MGTTGKTGAGIRDQQLVDTLVGHELGGFLIQEPIGAGGMGTVFRATQLSIGRTVAVKVVRDRAVSNEAERFLREARAISQIDHPNVVQLIDFGHEVDKKLMYYAMEHIDGLPLNVLAKGGRLHPNLVIELALQACSALAQTHAAGVIHRDLKASNMLVSITADGAVRLRVLDFGIASSFEDTANLTQTGVLCGTPAYMAPEQARGQKVTPHIDLYALGVNLHKLLAGQTPFSGGNAITIVMQHIQDSPPDLGVYANQGLIPGALVALTAELLAKEANQRPPSAAETRRRLSAIRQDLGWEAVEVSPADVATLAAWKRAPLARETGELPEFWRMPDEDQPTELLDATEAERRVRDTQSGPIPAPTGSGPLAAQRRSGPLPARSGGGWSAFNETPAKAAGSRPAMVLDPVTGEYMAVEDAAKAPASDSHPQRQAASAMALDVDNPRGRTFSSQELQVDLPPRPTPSAELPNGEDDHAPHVLKLVGVTLAACVVMLGVLLLVTSGEDAPPPPTAGIEALVGERSAPESEPPPRAEPKPAKTAKPSKTKPEVEVIDVFDDEEIGDAPRKRPIVIEEGE